MGGFGSGGHRAGAGRKKNPTHLRAIDGGAGRRGSGDVDDGGGAAEPTIEPPSDLSAEELAVWAEWAPLAIAEKTLTKATLGAFVHVIQLELECRDLDRALGRRRAGDTEPRPLLVMYPKEKASMQRMRLMVRKELIARMKDFKLAPFGKEILAPGAGEDEGDALDAFTRKRG